LAGIEFVHQFVALPAGKAFVEALWDEAEETLSPPAGLDIPAYRAALMQRFANSALNHRTRQIAMDGSQKLPQRLLAPIMARLNAGKRVDVLALAVAAWMRWQEGMDDSGAAHVVDDPLAPRTAGSANLTPGGAVAGLLAIDAIFPPALAEHEGFRKTLIGALSALRERGARATIEDRFG
jgi:fructuronate reductase